MTPLRPCLRYKDGRSRKFPLSYSLYDPSELLLCQAIEGAKVGRICTTRLYTSQLSMEPRCEVVTGVLLSTTIVRHTHGVFIVIALVFIAHH